MDTQDVAAVLETNHDSNYVELDTRHKSKNKIEISDIRKKIIDEDQMLNNISCGIKRSWDETDTNTSIDPLKRSRFSLTDAEAIEDLLLIRHNITKQNSHHEQNKNQQKEGIEQNQENQLEEVDIDEAEEEEGQEQSIQHNQEGVEREGEEEEEYGEEMDSDNDREETEAPIESILTSEQKNQRELYKEIIFKNDTTEGMKIQGLPPLDCFQIFQLKKRERILIYTTKISFAFRLATILCTVYFQLLCSYLLSYLRTYIYSWTIFYRLILFQKNTSIFQISLLYSFIQRIYKFKCFVGAIG